MKVAFLTVPHVKYYAIRVFVVHAI